MTGPEEDLPAQTTIVGCNGRMGKMLMTRAADAELSVCGIDRPFTTVSLQKAGQTQLALLCVPARHLEATLKTLLPYLPQTCILADITSVKEGPMRQMEAHWTGPVVGTHPLFGPKNKPGDALPVALVKGQNAGAVHVNKVRQFFEAIGCSVFSCSACEHDQAMAKIQNMNFITNLAYFAALAGDKSLLPFLTPSFERRKTAAAKMLTEDAEMFAGLFEANGHSHEAVRQYRRMLNLAASGDVELLCKRAQWWWQGEEDKQENHASRGKEDVCKKSPVPAPPPV